MRLLQQNLAATHCRFASGHKPSSITKEHLGWMTGGLFTLDAGFTFSGGVAEVNKGTEWHEQLNSFLMKRTTCLKQSLTKLAAAF